MARHREKLDELEKQLRATTPETKVLVLAADVSKPRDVERIIATTLSEFDGRLDVLVNNASTIGPAPRPYLLDYPLEDFQNVLATARRFQAQADWRAQLEAKSEA